MKNLAAIIALSLMLSSSCADRAQDELNKDQTEILSQAIQNQQDGLAECVSIHGDELSSHHTELTLQIELDHNSAVENVTVHGDSTLPEPFALCLEDRIYSWSFPQSIGATTINYPVTVALNTPPRPQTRDRFSIRDAFRAKAEAFETCYEMGLKDDPSLKGKIIAHVEFTPEGWVSQVQLDSQGLKHEAIESCLVQAVSEISLAASTETTTVTYPLSFSNSD